MAARGQGYKSNDMYNDKAATTATKGVKPLAPMHALTTCVPEHVTVAKYCSCSA